MMLLWLLWACTPCGTDPGSLDVQDPDGVASDEELAYAREGLANFVRWTARDAICVGEIRFVDYIEVDDGYSEIEAGGKYDPSSGDIELRPGQWFWTEFKMQHELCHALDRTEDIVESYPGVFAPTPEVLEQYPESLWEHEGFADRCEYGPSSVIERSYSELCGLEPTKAERVLDAVAFAPYDPGVLGQTELHVDWREIGLDDGERMRTLHYTFDGFAADYLDYESDDIENARVRLRLLGTANEPGADVDIGTRESADALQFVPWNHGIAAVDHREIDPMSFVVGRDGTITPASGLDGGGYLVWEDVVFAWDGEGIVGRDLWTGEDVDLALPEELVGESFSVLIGGDRVLLSDEAGQWVGTPSTGWTPRLAPTWALPAGHAWVSRKSGNVGGESLSALLVTLEDGSVALPLDLCDGFGGSLVSIDGSAWLLDHDDATDTWRVGPITVP